MIDVFVFAADDAQTPAERLEAAVDLYCGERGLPLPPRRLLKTARGEKGKPWFPHCPELSFSISHSGELWACALCGQPIGLDLQKCGIFVTEEAETRAVHRYRRVAERYFHPREAAFVEEAPLAHFQKIWTAKEAYVKYLGTGIDGDFPSQCVLPEDSACLAEDSAAWSAMGTSFLQTRLEAGYMLAACTAAEESWRILKL